MSDQELKVIGVREAGRADMVVILPGNPPFVLPPGPLWREAARGKWDWGKCEQAVADTARVLAEVMFNDPRPPDDIVCAITLLLMRQPLEGFELGATAVLLHLNGECGRERVARYLLNRVSVSACQERG